MDTKESIYQFLTEKSVIDPFSSRFNENTTGAIASRLHISRTLASQYLNELHKEERVVKIVSRPVVYLSAERLMKEMQVGIPAYTFEDIDFYKEWYRSNYEENSVIGFSGSLLYAISQIQTGLLYPNCGLPLLLSGQNGSGKKFLIRSLLAYHQQKQRLDSRWQLEMICVSQYASPQILLADLKKRLRGDVFCLFYLYSLSKISGEGLQNIVETLKKQKEAVGGFNFIVAVNDSEFRLFYQYLENHISVIAKIPSFSKRPLKERRAILLSLLQEEAKRLCKPLFISSKAFEILESLTNEVNITTLKRILVQSVANAYHKSIEQTVIRLSMEQLPNEISAQQAVKAIKDQHKETWMDVGEMSVHNGDSPFISLCAKLLKLVQEGSYQKKEEMSYLCDNIFYMVRSHMDEQLNSYYYAEMKQTFTLRMIEEITSELEDAMRLYMPPGFPYLMNEIYDLYRIPREAHALRQLEESEEVVEFFHALRSHTSEVCEIAKSYLKQLMQKLDFSCGTLTLLVVSVCLSVFNHDRQHHSIGALIISHGASTASSVCDTVNFLLGRKIFNALDMPLNMTVVDIAEKVNEYLRFHFYTYMIILVDMGSLKEITQYLENFQEITYGIINNISTSVALEVGSQIKNGQFFFDILETTLKNIRFEYQIIQSEHKKKTIVITSNMGQRATAKLASLFSKSMPSGNPFSIIEYDYEQLKEELENSQIFKEYDVALLVKPDILSIHNVPCISMEDLIYTQDNEHLYTALDCYMSKEQIEEFHMNLLKNFTLENVVETLTILNAKHLMDLVVDSVERLVQRLNKRIDARTRIGIYMHICFLVERLVTKNEIQSDEQVSERFLASHASFVEMVGQSFRNILDSYCVDLPVSEIMYLYDYIYEEE